MNSSTLPSDTPDALGRSLKALRRRRGLTQAALAQNLGIHRSYLSQLESGELSEQVKRVFDVLNALEARLIVEDRRLR
jgi:HTH-type transcriptional regulator / antitoxin HipB